MIEAVDCCNPDHWFDSRVGWPGRHDGGLPEDPKTPCVPFADNGDPNEETPWLAP